MPVHATDTLYGTENVVAMERRSHTLLIAAIIVMACLLRAPITAVGPVVDLIRADVTADSAVLGLLTTIPLLMFALVSPFTGGVSARLGAGRTILLSLVAVLFGILIRSYAGAPGLFAGTLLLGVGISFGNVLIPSVIKDRFADRIGPVTGVFTMCMSCFAGIASGVSLPLAASGLGWRHALAVWAILAAATFLFWLPQRRLRIAQGTGSGAPGAAVLHSPTAWWVTAFMAMQSTVFYCFVAWLPAILRERGIDAAVSGYYALGYQLIGIPASFFIPTIAARLPDQRGLIASLATVYAAGLAMVLLGQTAGILLCGTLICGFSTGACFSLCMLLISLRARNAADAARLSGMVQSIGYAVAAVGPLAMGALHDATGSFALPVGILLGLTALMLFSSRFVGRARFV